MGNDGVEKNADVRFRPEADIAEGLQKPRQSALRISWP